MMFSSRFVRGPVKPTCSHVQDTNKTPSWFDVIAENRIQMVSQKYHLPAPKRSFVVDLSVSGGVVAFELKQNYH